MLFSYSNNSITTSIALILKVSCHYLYEGRTVAILNMKDISKISSIGYHNI